MVCDAALEIIKRNEGCRLEAYRDVVGIPTIGFGHTGPDVSMGLVISQDTADELLARDLEKFETGVDRLLMVDTTANQFGAMVSLAYNIGLGAFRKSTVLRRHNAEDFIAAADAFRLWNKAGGKVFRGLVRRREEERALYLTE